MRRAGRVEDEPAPPRTPPTSVGTGAGTCGGTAAPEEAPCTPERPANVSPTPTNSEPDSHADDEEKASCAISCCPWLSFTTVQRPLLKQSRQPGVKDSGASTGSRSRARAAIARVSRFCRHRLGRGGRGDSVVVENLSVADHAV